MMRLGWMAIVVGNYDVGNDEVGMAMLRLLSRGWGCAGLCRGVGRGVSRVLDGPGAGGPGILGCSRSHLYARIMCA